MTTGSTLAFTAAQREVWIADQLDRTGTQHNCAAFLDLRGPLQLDLLAAAVERAVGETDALRIAVTGLADRPAQLLRPTPAPVRLIDLTDVPEAEAVAWNWMRTDLETAVDVSRDPLFEHVVLRLAPDRHLFHLRYHHVILDGFGQVVYWGRVAQHYAGLRTGTPVPPAPSAELAMLVEEDEDYARSGQHEVDRAYWHELLADRPEPVSLRRPGLGGSPARRHQPWVEFGNAREAATGLGTHWSVLVLGATAAYVARLTQQDEVVLGFPVRARTSRAALATPAMLSNVLPLRLRVDPAAGFGELVRHVGNRVSQLLAHQRYRGEQLRRELGGAAFTGVVVNLIGFDGELPFAECSSRTHLVSSGPVRDLSIDVFGGSDGSQLSLTFEANPELHEADAVAELRDRFVAYFQQVLAAGPATPLASLPILRPGERDRLLAAAAGEQRGWDWDRPLHELVLEQAGRTPDAQAASSTGQRLSYAELTRSASRLAGWLAQQGIGRGDVVGVHATRDTVLVVELLAVLMAGAAYLPLDPELPPSRLQFLVQDSGCQLVLSRGELSGALAGVGVPVSPVEALLPTLAETGRELPAVQPGDIAYVIYTSGSTGQPKGVAVPHRGVVNRLLWMQEQYRLRPTERVLQKTPFTFDVSVWEFFWPLLAGAGLHLADPGAHRDPRLLAEVIRSEQISTVHFVPSMLELFLLEPAAAELPSLTRVICSGEALRPEVVGQFYRRYQGLELHNLYGPTEASIDVTYWACGPGDAAGSSVPIGRAVANTQLYVLDREREPVPFGVPGELYLGGVQVAAGYLNRPELTERSFVANPFGPGRLYRTGDVVSLRPDGVVLYHGRIDDQVKVHGFRIEPGEISSALLRHTDVAQAALVTPVGPDGQRHLVGYVVLNDAVVSNEGATVSTEALQDWLRAELPPYMVPGQLLAIPAIPLLSNGKLNRAALAELAGTASAPATVPLAAAESPSGQAESPSGQAESRAQAEPPSGQAEQVLAEVWAEVLGTPVPDVRASFFTLGGDSMRAIRVRAAAERRGYTFSVFELFENPSVRELARLLRPMPAAAGDTGTEPTDARFELIGAADRALLPADVEDAYPISAMQAGMLFHAAYSQNSSVYRVVTSVRVGTGFDQAALAQALADTFTRHPSLRCSFDLTGYSEPLQLVHREVAVPLTVAADLTGLAEPAQRAVIEAWCDAAKFTIFDPAQPPLLAFTVHLLADDAFELSVVEHHVVLDGWSDLAMLAEIVEHYSARLAGTALDRPPVATSYREFVAAEREISNDPAAREFWQRELAGAEASLVSPNLAGPEEDFSHERFDVELPDGLADRLRELAAREALPLKAVLATAHLAVLRLVCGTDEVLTGLIANARLEQPGGDETIGVFLNTLPLRAELGSQSLLEVAHQVFAFEQRASAYRRYPYAEVQRDLGEALQLDSYVNYMDFRRDGDTVADRLMQVTVGVAETNYPLAANFMLDPDEGRLQLWLDCGYSGEADPLWQLLPGYYLRALHALADRPEQALTELDLLGPDEYSQLARWNDTAADYDRTATLHGLVAAQAALAPDAVALAHRDEEISYRALDARANQLAHRLVAAGIRPGDRVGVCQRRSIELVVSLLAVLKTGAAYVPMDAGYPISRLRLIADDAGLSGLVTGEGTPDGLGAGLPRVDVVAERPAIAGYPDTAPAVTVAADDQAYVIYTSGSTGKPKGTGIRHRSVVNFFRGMADTVGCAAEDVLLAVTSVSFDISVLEIFWPLTRGAKVVLAGENIITNLVQRTEAAERTLGFSLFFFAASAGESNAEGYRLVLDAARFADTHGFEAVWTPERHFHAFGGLYPNPSVMSAALATITERIGLRSGSVVSPLHETVRLVEEWSLVDNLSNGRVGLAFAAGWNSNDFVIRPENFADRKEIMAAQLIEFGRLWRGEPVQRGGGSGQQVDVTIFPSPVQPMPPIWLTSVGTVATFERAGTLGANLLTHLLGQDPGELTDKIKAYRLARQQAGHDGPGRVTAMVHTYVGEDTDEARRKARAPFANYLRSSTELWRTLFASTNQAYPELDAEEQVDAVIELAIDRYFESSGLFGSPESCAEVVRTLVDVGVDEIACLVDFGLPPQEVLDGLAWVDRLRIAHETEVAESRHSLAALCERHGVTMLQGTPSLFAAVAAEPAVLESLRDLRALLVGGEAFPSGLAQRLLRELPDVAVFNLYGPTETTIWSTVHRLSGEDALGRGIPIGRPIANTVLRVADRHGRPVPVGRSGELWIGGDGVATGYLGRPELTAERFVELDGQTYYRTGDRVRWRPDGTLEFLGRVDRQVKILGHRIEPDEIESVLSRHAQVDAVAVKAVEGSTGTELIAYVSPAESPSDAEVQTAHVQRWGQAWDTAYTEGGAEQGEDFAGWLSSFTGEPIPDPEMREWLARTVERIAAFEPDSVVDVGVGVGLIMRSLARQVREYHGIDLSPAALRSAAHSLGGPLPSGVHLVRSGPEYLRSLEPQSLDLVVINSVAQYFPSLDYLRTVLTDAARVVHDGGAVFVGDVRSLELLPEFFTAVQVSQAPPLQTVDEIRSAIGHRAQEERELCVSPQFFTALAAELPRVGEVRLELKRGEADNELTLFRYDASLLIGLVGSDSGVGGRLRWAELTGGLDELRSRLAGDPGGLTVLGVPNQRLTRVVQTMHALAELDGSALAWDLDRQLWPADPTAGVHPEAAVRLAAELGRPVRVSVPADGRLDHFDLVFPAASTAAAARLDTDDPNGGTA